MLAALVLLSLAHSQAPDPNAPAFVDNCDPCKIVVSAAGPAFEAHFLLVTSPEGRYVRRIGLVRDGKQVQELVVPEAPPVSDGERFMFGGVDINFDGNLDLMLLLERGAANSMAQYWLYEPASQTFKDAGTHPVFTIDAERKRLKTYQRGGSGGMAFTSREFQFRNGLLTLMREEIQRPAKTPGRFQHTIRERRGAGMVVVKQETISPPQP